ncbi:MAG: 4-alpha-glucanotransferase [Verrucomicrobia bacterium]|nr:4-alpha-glucanotransferase [Verrucomicrobiota bacterium]
MTCAPLFDWLTSRAAGVLLHPTSLPGSTGIGTLGADARRFVQFLADSGFKYWQVCPLGPTGYGDSPYQCFSAFAGNPYLIDLETLVTNGFLDNNDLAPLRRTSTEYVDYGAQWAHRWEILRRAYANFSAKASQKEKQAFYEFAKANRHWLEPYARFVATKSRFEGRSWLEWPPELKQHDSARKLLRKTDLAEEYEAQTFYQYEFFSQWRALKQYANSLGISILGDIPIFVALDSADVWLHPELFQMDADLNPTAQAGVPPDYFAADGQLWGNPLYDWKKHEQRKFSWWLARLEASFELYDAIRIDHFRAFDEYCRIPAHASSAREYKWEPGPGLRFFQAVKARFPDAKMVAEDLGLIGDSVRKLVAECGVPGMKVLQFAFEGASDYLPHNAIPNSVLYPGTHDNDTAWGWWEKQPEPVHDFFRRYLRVSGDAVPWDMVRAGFSSASRLFIVPLQDLLSRRSEARLNTPGSSAGNWRWRFTSEQLERLQAESGDYLRELARLYER